MDKPFPAYQGDEPYVFVCYAHEDSDIVYPEIAWLREQGTNLWYDEGIAAGRNWREAIGNSLLGASQVLFYITARSLVSDHCNREINLSLDEGKDVVPVYLEDVELTPDLKVGLNRVQALHRDQDASYQQHLLRALGRSAGTPTTPRTVASPVRRLRWWQYAGGALVLAIVIGATWFYSLYEDVTTAYSIAVLPFINVSTDEETGFFARGLSENILDKLAEREFVRPFPFGKLKVASRTASFQFADKGDELSVIAEKLDVAYVLEGSVQRLGDSLHITAQLVRAEDNFHVWSESYERAFADGFEMQVGVAQHIVQVVESELVFDFGKRYVFLSAVNFGTNSVALDHLLNAWKVGDAALREQLLLKAVEADPEFSLAYAMLADAYLGRVGGNMPLQEATLAAHAAISRAIELNPNRGQAWQTLGLIYLELDLDYANAEASFMHGIAIASSDVPGAKWPYANLAAIALREGRVREALRLMATASELDAGGQQARFLNRYAWVSLVTGDYEQSLEAYAQAQNFVPVGRGRAPNLRKQTASLIGLGRIEEAALLLAKAWDLDGTVKPEAYISAFVSLGERERAERMLADSENDNGHVSAVAYLALEDVDKTFTAIEAAIEDHDVSMIESLRIAEWWDPIRDDPRFDHMLELLDSKETHTAQYLTDLDIEDNDILPQP